jgi:hypothetical protein
MVAGAIVVVAVVVVSGLYLGGVAPFAPKASQGAGGALTFDAARAAGDAFTQGYEGGGWGLLAAGGLASRASLSIPIVPGATSFANCTVQAAAGVTEITAPASPGPSGSGAASAWELVYWGNPGGLIVSVVNGTASLAASITGTSTCRELFSYVQSISAGIVDSSEAVQAADARGGSAFLSAHPGANLSMGVWGGISVLFYTLPSTWRISYSLCSLTATHPQPEPAFNATVSSGGVVTGMGEGLSNCTAPSALGTAIGGSGPTPGGSGLGPFLARLRPG